MGGIFGGGGGSQSETPKALNGIQTLQSSYGNCIPLVYGRTRIPGTMIWYTNFTATAHTSGGGGGKGGGGGTGSTSYTYSASVIIMLAEGQITNVNNTFADKAIHGPGYSGGSTPWVGSGNALTDFGFTLFTGAVSQAAWTGWPSNTPTAQRLGYSTTAYVTANNFSLGSGAQMPNMTFEVNGLLAGLGTPYVNSSGDVDPASVAYDYCSDGTHGCGFGPYYDQTRNNGITGSLVCSITTGTNQLTIVSGTYTVQTMPIGTALVNATAFPSGATITAFNPYTGVATMSVNASATVTNGTFTYQPHTWQAYCMSYGFYLSPSETTQRAAQDFLTELLTITNSDSIWSNGKQVIIPLDDSTVSGNGYTHIPNNGAGGVFTTPVYSFTDDDYIDQNGEDPVVVTRKGVSDTYNKVNVEFLDRSNQYNTSIAQASDATDIAVNGERVMQTVQLHSITDPTVARLVAQLILQRQLYYKNSYRFQVRADYCLLEPMDVIALNDSGLGLNNTLVRIDTIEEDGDGLLTIEAIELPFGPGLTPQYNYQAGARGFYLANTSPGAVQTPVIVAAPPQLVQSSMGYEIYIAANGPSGSTVWGGCNVWMSYDNVNYVQVGVINGGARMGTVTGATMPAYTTNPVDTTSFLQVTLNDTNKTLAAANSQSDADQARTLIYVNGEWMAYQYCTLVSTGVYGFSSTGASGGTVYLQRALYGSPNSSHAVGTPFVRMDGSIFRMPIDPGTVGQTLYFKLQSFNIYGQGINALSSETAYSFVVSQQTGGTANQVATLLPRASCSYVGGTLFKNASGTAAWDSDVYTQESYSNGSIASWKINNATDQLVVGLSLTPSSSGSSYTAVTYGIYHNAGTLYVVESGAISSASFGTYAAKDSFAVQHDGKFVRYAKNGVVFRSVVSSSQTLSAQCCIYTPNGSVSNFQFVQTQPAVNAVLGNFLDTRVWRVGTSGSQGNFIDQIGGGTPTTASSIVLSANTAAAPLGPYGTSEVLWSPNAWGNTGSNGGFRNGVGGATGNDLQGLDPSKTYRYTVWFQWTGTTPTGALLYFGCDEGGATYNLAGTVNNNPYFVSGAALSSLTAGRWYLLVGYLHGNGYTGGNITGTNVAGIYDSTTNLNVYTGTDYMLAPGATAQTFRVFVNAASGTTQDAFFCRPRFEMVNGTEPSIQSMLVPANLDQLPNGTTYGKVNNTALTSGNIDPSKSGFLTNGSVPPSVPAGTFSYTASPTQVTLICGCSSFRATISSTTMTVSSAVTFTGGVSTSTNLLTVTAVTAGTFAVGAVLYNNAAANVGVITSFGSGTTGTTGTYNVSGAVTVGAGSSMVAEYGFLSVGQLITGTGVTANTHIIDIGTGGAGLPNAGTYTLDQSSAVSTITTMSAQTQIYRADGTVVTFTTGNTTITGLVSNNTYRVYPYTADSGGTTATVSWVTSTTAATGTPQSAFYTNNSYAASQMYSRGNLPLGSFQITTPATGSGGGGGGGGGCLHPSTQVEIAMPYDAGATDCKAARDLQPGDLLFTPSGPRPITRIERRPCSRWFGISVDNKFSMCIVTHDHKFFRATGEMVLADALRLGDLLRTDSDHAQVTKLHLFSDRASVVSIELDDPHLYYLGTQRLLCHNPKP